MARWGFVALFVDNLGTRGLTETCAVDFGEADSEALGALLYLSMRRDVDPARIAVVGYSQGAGAALNIAAGLVAPAPDGPHFKAAIHSSKKENAAAKRVGCGFRSFLPIDLP